MPKRLPFIDGMRGLLAVIVVVYHITESVSAASLQRYPEMVRLILEWVRNGAGDRVAMFSALSGFCLMLPVLADPNRRIRGGAWEFLRRRGARILPAYYVALLLAVVLQFRVYLDGRITHQQFSAHCDPPKILSHLLLVHNYWDSHIFALIGPAWNLAIEAQLYVVFCLALVPLWRRCGGLDRPACAAAAVLATATLLGGVALALPASNGSLAGALRTAGPWLTVPFATGMLGAAAAYRAFAVGGATRLRWGRYALGVAAVRAGLPLFVAPPFGLRFVLAGLLCTLLLGVCIPSEAPAPGLHRGLRRILESRALLWLGACSYSVYLTHALVLPRADSMAMRLLPAPLAPLSWLFQLAAALFVGYGFYVLVERPCSQLPRRAHTPRPARAPVAA